MTIEELAVNCNISLEKLKRYEEYGLIHGKVSNCEVSYEYEDLSSLGILNVLEQVGFEMNEIVSYTQLSRNGNKEKQILMLTEKRKILLEIIHEKQQILDNLDYLITEMKRTGGDIE